jgi:hypothetical protein
MALGGPKVAFSQGAVPDTPWPPELGPLCVGNLSLAVLKKNVLET